MTSPQVPETIASAEPIACGEAGCERPVVHAAPFCRVHLAEAFRRDGEPIAFRNAEFAGIQAAAIHFVRTALEGFPEDLAGAGAAIWPMDMYAWVSVDADWKLAQVGLDVLAAVLSDEPPFSGTFLSPPMDFPTNEILLRLQVGVPTFAVQELRERLELVMEAMVREMVGPGTKVTVAVEPAEEPSGSV